MIELLRNRLTTYGAIDSHASMQALKEIVQEVVLYALWRANFFTVAAFQGGTSLRILYGLPRFSEDLDFILQRANTTFRWHPYFQTLSEVLEEFGIQGELIERKKMDSAIRQALLKDDSIAHQLNLNIGKGDRLQKIKIKFEIDTQPPEGSSFIYHYLDFPLDYEICAQDLPSNFALKIHALLCRPYVKGRDWFDFSWYVAKRVIPSMPLLQNALQQYGAWAGTSLYVNSTWLNTTLQEKIESIDWQKVAQDVAPFLQNAEQQSLKLWNTRFFNHKLKLLIEAINIQ